MTELRKAAEMALEALEKQHNWMVANGGGEMFAIPSKKAINELRQALAEPEQEPVGYVTNSGRSAWIYKDIDVDDDTPLYTAPPKQEWDGPTDEEYENFCSLIQREEAKLKEKNAND
jgi:uncharacterized UPF0160 family protein